jgi:hypothetical protein
VLLSDEKVKNLLGNDVIPVWQSVRQVPKVTIDFGNGKKLERTLKGNTVIYLLNSDGRVVDAYPGVYTPQDFLGEVSRGMAAMKKDDPAALTKFHKSRVEYALGAGAEAMASKARVESPLLALIGDTAYVRSLTGANGFSSQVEKEPITTGKSVEAPVLKGLDVKTFANKKDETPLPVKGDLADAFEQLSSRIEDISNIPMSPGTARRAATGGQANANMTPEQVGELAVKTDSRQNLRFVRPAVHMLLSMYEQPPKPEQVRDLIFKKILHVKIDDPYLGLNDLVLPGTPKSK